MDAARHQVIARAFRRALGQDRRFHFDKTVLVEVIAEHLRRFGTKLQRALHFRTAQVEVTILQPQRLVDIDAVFDEERRVFGRVHNFEFGNLHFDFAGRQVRVHRFRITLDDFTANGQHVLVARTICDAVRVAGKFRVEHDLHKSAPVAQVNEQDAPEVAAALYPAVQSDGFTDVGFT